MEKISDNRDILHCIEIILAENGETQILSRFRLTSLQFLKRKKRKNRISEPLIFEHLIGENDKILKLPLTLNYHVNLSIDWGDGNITEIKNTDELMLKYIIENHEYETPGLYQVKIRNITYDEKMENSVHLGHFPNWADNIKDFITIGRIGITELDYMFSDTKFNGIIRPNWDTSKITNMSGMFCGASRFNQKIGDNWDTRNVRDMSWMFSYTKSFNQKIGENWDTRNVRNMRGIFSHTTNFNQKIGENWDTGNVRDMSYMFYYSTNFNQQIGDNWNTRNVRDMSFMFCDTRSFNQKIGENWDIRNVRDMSYMFYGAENFNQKIGENWDTGNVRDMSYMFSYAINFNQKIGENWDTGNVRDMSHMFYCAESFNQKIGEKWDISKAIITDMFMSADKLE